VARRHTARPSGVTRHYLWALVLPMFVAEGLIMLYLLLAVVALGLFLFWGVYGTTAVVIGAAALTFLRR
jgi:hypothetical protein